MKNFTIKIGAGEEMDKLHMEIKKDNVLISVDTLKERGII